MSLTLEHRFVVPLPVEETWSALMDVRRVALCMPGASLESAEDGEFRGKVSVRLGPITTRFRGQARFGERDDMGRRAVLVASGREIGGSSTAEAAMTVQVAPAENGSAVAVSTDLAITGKVAKFGRGVIGEVAGRLVEQFATALTEELCATPAASERAATERTVAEQAPEQAPPGHAASAPAASATPAPADGAPGRGATDAARSARASGGELDLLAVLFPPAQRRRAAAWATALAGGMLILRWRRRRRAAARIQGGPR